MSFFRERRQAADMIGMLVGDDHRIEVFGALPDRRQPLRNAAIAEAGVDQQAHALGRHERSVAVASASQQADSEARGGLSVRSFASRHGPTSCVLFGITPDGGVRWKEYDSPVIAPNSPAIQQIGVVGAKSLQAAAAGRRSRGRTAKQEFLAPRPLVIGREAVLEWLWWPEWPLRRTAVRGQQGEGA